MSKIMVGIPFYGLHYGKKQAKPIDSKEYLRILEKHEPVIEWDPSTQEHVAELSGNEVVVYPSLKFIEERLHLAEYYNVGVGIWELGQGLDYFMHLF